MIEVRRDDDPLVRKLGVGATPARADIAAQEATVLAGDDRLKIVAVKERLELEAPKGLGDVSGCLPGAIAFAALEFSGRQRKDVVLKLAGLRTNLGRCGPD